MINEEFIDILDFTGEKFPHDDDETLNSVLKDDEFQDLDTVSSVGEKEVVKNDQFVINLIKKDGEIDEIEIECKCGNKTTIKLNYEGSLVGNSDADSSIEPEAPADSLQNGEDQGFQEGIPAEVSNEIPKIDAVPKNQNLDSPE